MSRLLILYLVLINHPTGQAPSLQDYVVTQKGEQKVKRHKILKGDHVKESATVYFRKKPKFNSGLMELHLQNARKINYY